MAGAKHQTRIGVVLYAKRIYTLFPLGDPEYSTRESMIEAIEGMDVLGGNMKLFTHLSDSQIYE